MLPPTNRSSELKTYKEDLAQYKSDLIKYQSDLIKYQKNLNECRKELQRCHDQIGNHRAEMQGYRYELDKQNEDLQRFCAQRRGAITMVNYPERQAQINGWLAWSDTVTAKLELMYGEYFDPPPVYEEVMGSGHC